MFIHINVTNIKVLHFFSKGISYVCVYDDPDSGLMSYYGKGHPNNSDKESREKKQEDCSPEVRKQINQLCKDLILTKSINWFYFY